jgi:hypothetical protein
VISGVTAGQTKQYRFVRAIFASMEGQHVD